MYSSDIAQKAISDNLVSVRKEEYINEKENFNKLDTHLILKSYFNDDYLYITNDDDYLYITNDDDDYLYITNYNNNYSNEQKVLDEIDENKLKQILFSTKDEINSFINNDNLLFKAVINGDVNQLKLFLDCGLNPNVKNKQGQTLIVFALLIKRLKIVELFLQYNVDIFIPDNNGLMFLDYCDLTKMEDIKMLLLTNYNLSVRSHHKSLPHITSLEMAYDMIDHSSEKERKTSIKNLINHFINNRAELADLFHKCNNIEVIKNLFNNNICIDIFYSPYLHLLLLVKKIYSNYLLIMKFIFMMFIIKILYLIQILI